jgi:hypothetical protein
MVNALAYLLPVLALAAQAAAQNRMDKRTCSSGSSGSSASVSVAADAEIAYSFEASVDVAVNVNGVLTTFAGLDLGVGTSATLGSIFTSTGAYVSSSVSLDVTESACASSFLDTFTITIGEATCTGKNAVYSSKGWKCPCSGSTTASAAYGLYLQAGSDLSLKTYASYSAIASKEWDFHFYAGADATVQVLSLDKPTKSSDCEKGCSCTLKYSKSGKCQG